ncbi:Diguanylate phosphodiesterase, predicted domain protein [Candidatus Magnetoovum chiemensis]|nr:Diguanylate phosphodiesterase, predicted domain protein [Candidatus Magnetoovum chiemensis]
MTTDYVDLAFVKGVVTLAKELKIKLIAEFVETEEILKYLEKLDVEYAQGYYIEKPLKDLTPYGTKPEKFQL